MRHQSSLPGLLPKWRPLRRFTVCPCYRQTRPCNSLLTILTVYSIRSQHACVLICGPTWMSRANRPQSSSSIRRFSPLLMCGWYVHVGYPCQHLFAVMLEDPSVTFKTSMVHVHWDVHWPPELANQSISIDKKRAVPNPSKLGATRNAVHMFHFPQRFFGQKRILTSEKKPSHVSNQETAWPHRDRQRRQIGLRFKFKFG